MKRQDIREHLFRLLFRLEFNEPSEMEEQLSLYFDSDADEEDSISYQIPKRDREYITEKFQRIRGQLSELDSIIASSARGWELERMGKVELTILRLATYEVLFDEDIPVGVAIDQAVELAKKYGQEESSAFVNGVLANIART
ncbi:MAG: transcription antitermination factor NusB [Lachnospiraceae bacterium]|nr:transcription antitermination factor NusB [Lachnospiraceae bacterium]